jgi:hypothetical protein
MSSSSKVAIAIALSVAIVCTCAVYFMTVAASTTGLGERSSAAQPNIAPTGTKPSDKPKPAPGGNAPVTASRLTGALLESIRGDLALWTFSTDRFALKLGNRPEARALAEKLMGKKTEALRIEGRWKLDSAQGRIELSEIQAGDERGVESVSLAIEPAGLIRINIDAMQFNFFALEQLFGRDGKFTQSDATPPTIWSFQWNPVLEQNGRFAISREGEPLPGALVKSLFGEEKTLTKIEGEWRKELGLPSLDLYKISSGKTSGKTKSASNSNRHAPDGACWAVWSFGIRGFRY